MPERDTHSGIPTCASPLGAYVHVPFCRHRCGYCNFTLVAGRDDLMPAYLDAVEREMSWLGSGHSVETLFFGGGTPSHLPLAALDRLCQATRSYFPPRVGYEWSIEANPRDVTADWCLHVAKLGITRVSLGVQSFSPKKLSILERDHDESQVIRAVDYLRDHGLHIAIDLIFAAPDETLEEWRHDLELGLSLQPQHISTYGLTFERGTRFLGRKLRGDLRVVEESIEGAMYELAIDRLTDAGFEHYEVSNFARPGQRCRHNESYWLGHEYFGVGPGAASHIAGTRRMNHRGTLQYLRRVELGLSPVVECETLSDEERARERLVFGLRRMQGVSKDAFWRQSGWQMDQLGGSPLRSFLELELLVDDGETVRLTRRGLLISDAMWPDLLVGEARSIP